jgi:hypothetical protein
MGWMSQAISCAMARAWARATGSAGSSGGSMDVVQVFRDRERLGEHRAVIEFEYGQQPCGLSARNAGRRCSPRRRWCARCSTAIPFNASTMRKRQLAVER